MYDFAQSTLQSINTLSDYGGRSANVEQVVE
jgi:hypothetical protein